MDILIERPIERNKPLRTLTSGAYFPKWGFTSILSPYNAFSKRYIFWQFWDQNPQIWAEPNLSRKIGLCHFSTSMIPNFTQQTKN